jgi:ribosomal protein S18 acetylase RimI-like enzyme
MHIADVTEADLSDLLPLMRAYCDFYDVAPPDDDLIALSRTLLANPAEGVQLLARDESGVAAGFATVYWSWSTLSAQRIGIMYDLFVSPDSRGSGLAEALITACAERCRARGIRKLTWSTAVDNHRAQRVYDRVGGKGEMWMEYSLPIAG